MSGPQAEQWREAVAKELTGLVALNFTAEVLVDGDVTGSLLVGGAGRGGGASGDPIIGGFMRDLEAALDAGVLSADFALASLHSVAIDDDGDPLAVMDPDELYDLVDIARSIERVTAERVTVAGAAAAARARRHRRGRRRGGDQRRRRGGARGGARGRRGAQGGV